MKSSLLIVFLLLIFFNSGISQDIIGVSGTVKDKESNEPLIGVSVSVINKPGFGAITDKNGAFELKKVDAHGELLFTFIGYDTLRVKIKERENIDVTLAVAEHRLSQEVVVTATGSQTLGSITGAITSVNMEDIKHTPPTSSITNVLGGNVAGIMTMQTSGQPGKDISNFWIRGISTFGANDGAYVLVDGFERSLEEINIDDIASISVLKDASATAMYGSKGANGVVLITTKHGREGKINIDAKFETSYNTRTITPEFMDGLSYAKLMNEARVTRNRVPIYSPAELAILEQQLDPDLYPNVDWKDKLLKDGAMTTRANLNLSGGGTRARYFVSGSYLNEQGMYKTDKELRKDYNTNASYKRWNYRLNTDIDVTATTIVKLGVAGWLAKRNSPQGGDDVWPELFGYSPIRTPIMYSNGYVPAIGEGNKTNPWVHATQEGFREHWDNDIQTNVTLDQNFDFLLKGLHFIGRFGYDTHNNSNIYRIKWPEQWLAERSRDKDGNLIFNKVSDPSEMHQESSSDGDRREFLDLHLSYHHEIENHHMGGDVKYTQDAFIFTQNLGDDLKNGVAKKNQGLAGHVNYNWAYKYYFDFNFGYTGSENFAFGHQFGFFPAYSLAWNIAEEKFIRKNLDWIDMFKIRFSHGKVGNDNLGGDRFPYLYTIDGGKGGYEWAEFGNSRSYGGRGFSQVASPLVTWEMAIKNDLGVDLSLFNDAFSLTVDYFDEKRTGIYMARNFLSEMVGLESTPSANVGSVQSKGFDGNFRYEKRMGEISLTLRGNITYSKNKILEKDEENSVYPYQLEEGYRVDQAKGLIALGLFEDYEDIRNSPTQKFGPYQPGDIKYKDVNGDGVVDGGDRVAIGATTRPNLFYGVGASVRWKGLDLNILFQGAGHSNFFIYGKTIFAFSEEEWGNVLKGSNIENRWISKDISGNPSTENPNAPYPRLSYGGNGNNQQGSTYWLRDGRYIRLKNLDIGYTLSKEFLNRLHISNIRVFIVGENLLTWAPFKLWDPEMADPRGEQYPPARKISVGININL